MSPTSVYSRRSSEPSSAAAAGPVVTPMPSSNGARPVSTHNLLTRAWAACISSAASTARPAWSGTATGAPNTAMTASPTNCMTVPLASMMARFISARCTFSCPASALGSARSAMLEYPRMSDMSTLTTTASVSPMPRPWRTRRSATPPGSNRLRVSPCSSRLTMASCSMRSRRKRVLPARTGLLGDAQEELLDGVAGGGRGYALGDGDGLDGPAFGHEVQQRLLGFAQVPGVGDGVHHRLDDGGVEHRAAGGDGPHRPGQLVALGDVVLQEIGTPRRALVEQRDGVLGVVELRQDDDAGPGVALADLVRRLDALVLEAGGHPDVGDDHLGGELAGPVHELVVVGGGAHDLHVRLECEQGLHARSHDEVVVGEKHADGAPWHAPIWPVSEARVKGAPPRPQGGASRCLAGCVARSVAWSDPAPAPVRQHPPGAVVPGHAVDATAGVRRGRAQVEALHRRAVAEPPGNGPEHQLLVERATTPTRGRRPRDWGSRSRGREGCAPRCPPPGPRGPGRGPRGAP